MRLAGHRAILLPAALLAATLVALQAVPAAADEGWTIDAFDVDIIVHQDATMAVRETVTNAMLTTKPSETAPSAARWRATWG